MKIIPYIVFFLLFRCALGQATKKLNKLLSRKKRYLLFVQGSNFVYTIIVSKIFLFRVPKSVVWTNEWSIPFALPSDATALRDLRRHHIHRRHILENFETTLVRYGLNGTACVNRMICEAQEFIPSKGKSLIKDMLYAVFSSPESDDNDTNKFQDSCNVSNFEACSAPLLHIMLGSFNNY